MRERLFHIAAPALLAFLASGISSPDHGSIAVTLGHSTHYLNSGFLCMDTAARLLPKSSGEVEAKIYECGHQKLLSSYTRMLNGIDPNDNTIALVNWDTDQITDITKVPR